MDKTKIATAVVSCFLVVGAGTFALAAPQILGPAQASSEIISSAPVSSIISSSAEEASKVDIVSSQAPASSAETVTSQPKAKAEVTVPASSSPSSTFSMVPNKVYYAIVDPETGLYLGPDNPKYFDIKTKLGGSAGEVPPDQSPECQQALKALKDKNAAHIFSSVAQPKIGDQAPNP